MASETHPSEVERRSDRESGEHESRERREVADAATANRSIRCGGHERDEKGKADVAPPLSRHAWSAGQRQL
jgi:hypothetical protein